MGGIVFGKTGDEGFEFGMFGDKGFSGIVEEPRVTAWFELAGICCSTL